MEQKHVIIRPHNDAVSKCAVSAFTRTRKFENVYSVCNFICISCANCHIKYLCIMHPKRINMKCLVLGVKHRNRIKSGEIMCAINSVN